LRYLIAGSLLALLAFSVQASTIVSQRLLIRPVVDGVAQTSQQVVTTTSSELDLVNFNGGGWTGNAELVTSGTPGATFTDPYDLSFTHVDLYCGADPGETCDSLSIQFTDTVQLLTGADYENQPYSISLTGSGPDAMFSLMARTGGTQIFPAIAARDAPAGNYSFSTSGLIKNIPASNLTGAVTFTITGNFGVLSGNPGDAIQLPDSFALTLGAAPLTVTPEPGTWSLAGGCLLFAIGAFGLRRRMGTRDSLKG